MKRTIFLLTLVSCLGTMAYAQTAWQLKKEKEGIKIYAGDVPNANIKAFRVTCTLDATLSQLTALLLDIKAHERWVYSTKTSYLVKQLGPNHCIYYSEMSLPWPLTNRDVVAEMNISQQPGSKVMYVTVNAVGNYVPLHEDKVRVPLSKVSWTVTLIGNSKLSIEYIAQVDPGGDIPAWLVNSFSAKSLFETFRKLKEIVALPAYRQGQNDVVKD